MTVAQQSVCIAGAGSIGCFVGGMLAAGGHRVSLLARPRIIAEIEAHGLTVTSLEGLSHRLDAASVALSAEPDILSAADVIVVTVKSADTADIAGLIARYARSDATVVSLQNGVGNVDVLRQALQGRKVLAGMVPFNVIALEGAKFHRATSGDILVERDDTDTAARLSVDGLAIRATDDIAGVQWGKLVVNLNNALNALSGLPLREQLARRAWRRLLADQMTEALAVIGAEGIAPIPTTPLPMWLTPYLLRLPDGVFRLLLGQMMQIDPQARSSMWEDLQRGRRTEIDYLQGVIVTLADRHGLKAPLSRRIVTLIRQAEADAKGSPGLSAEQIRGAGQG
ncbi:MAG: 2-dehydropantoate 2-reductase [Rhizobiales bacterium]|nr:2-dehydropantoate 2-reductase [Hyphomicrobiales bacterium]